jgi:hypothetical protein
MSCFEPVKYFWPSKVFLLSKPKKITYNMEGIKRALQMNSRTSKTFTNQKNSSLPIKKYFNGSRCLENSFWAVGMSLGGLCFFMAGLSSFWKINFLVCFRYNEVAFFPQGLILLFYGTLGSILGIFLLLNVWWNVGSGYNEYNRDIQKVILYRNGFPGKNKTITFTFAFQTIKAIQVRIQEGINLKHQVLMFLKDNREVPLTGSDPVLLLQRTEVEALSISKYLNIALKTE